MIKWMTMKRVLFLLVAAGTLMPAVLGGEPVSLSTAYQKALDYDARLQAAKADNAVQQEEIGKARSYFRPSVQGSARRGRNATESTTQGLFGPVDQEFFYNTKNYGISVRQSVFNAVSIARYSQSKAVAAKSDAVLKSEQSQMIMRTAEAYFNLLYAEDSVVFSRARLEAVKEQLEQAKKRYGAGFGTVTEVNEAEAEHDMAKAEELEIQNALARSRREMQTITGVYPDELRKLMPEKLVLDIPGPRNVEEWVALSKENNQVVEAARQEIRIATKEVDKNRYAGIPTLDLLVGRTWTESDNNYSIGSKYDTYSLAAQLTVPIYTGGHTSAAVRQAKAKRIAAHERFNLQERETLSNVRLHFDGLTAAIAQIRAYEQAVKSSEIALTGTRKGYGAGLRSNVDVLNAQEKLYLSKRNLAKARYRFILNRMMLKDAAGLLSESEVYEINGWLE